MSSTPPDIAPEQQVNDRLGAEYSAIVLEILRRLNAIMDSLAELNANPKHPDNWKNCDFCWLQMRKICEYLAVAIVFVHHCETGAVVDLTKWRPKDLLTQAKNLSNHPTPVLVSPSPVIKSGGERQIVPLARPIRPEMISEVYGRCSDVLHLGSVGRILADGLPPYDVPQMQKWAAAFRSLMENHVLLLPEVRTILLCHTQAGNTDTFVLAGEGVAVFNTSDLPEFDLEGR